MVTAVSARGDRAATSHTKSPQTVYAREGFAIESASLPSHEKGAGWPLGNAKPRRRRQLPVRNAKDLLNAPLPLLLIAGLMPLGPAPSALAVWFVPSSVTM